MIVIGLEDHTDSWADRTTVRLMIRQTDEWTDGETYSMAVR